MGTRGFIHEVILDPALIEEPEAYPFSIPAIRALDRLPLDPKVTIFVGENGAGKSTLIEALAISAGLNPEGGTKNLKFSTRATESSLHNAIRLVRGVQRERSAFFLRAETMFNVATEVERLGLAEYGWTDVHARSHGEAFLWIVQNRLAKRGLYIFDEPESALSPQRQLSLLRVLHDLVSTGSQLILATHSPILLAYPGATIYQLDADGMRRVAYEDTEHYTVTRAFLNHREPMLRELLRDP